MVQYNNERKLLRTEHMYGCVSKGSCHLGQIHCILTYFHLESKKIKMMYNGVNPLWDNTELISLSSGLKIPTERAAADMLEAKSKNETEVLKFIDERLLSQLVDFFSSLKWLKVGSFTEILKKPVKMKSNKLVQFSSQRDIFGKITIIQQLRNVSLKKVFCYPLGPVPWSIAYSSNDIIKTSKSRCPSDITSSYIFRPSKVWSMLHHGSVGASSE